jgi:hypothetical protein
MRYRWRLVALGLALVAVDTAYVRTVEPSMCRTN